MSSRLGKSTFALLDGSCIAFQEWGNKQSKKKILALHGWLDNSNTHTYLAPYLAERGYHVVALDYCGHGKSSHLPRGSNYLIQKHVSHMHDIIQLLQWNFDPVAPTVRLGKQQQEQATAGTAESTEAVPTPPSMRAEGYELNLVGHSMGAAISVLYASAFPEVVTGKVVLIENFGQLTKPATKCATALRRGIEAEHKLLSTNYDSKQTFSPKVYPSLDDAIDARLKTVSMLPGKQTMARSSAELLVRRGSTPIEGSDSAVRFNHDTSLYSPSLHYFTEEHVRSCIDCIRAKTMVIFGETGWPLDEHYGEYDTRLKVMLDKPGNQLKVVKIPGSHHLHIDTDTAPLCAEHVFNFLSDV